MAASMRLAQGQGVPVPGTPTNAIGYPVSTAEMLVFREVSGSDERLARLIKELERDPRTIEQIRTPLRRRLKAAKNLSWARFTADSIEAAMTGPWSEGIGKHVLVDQRAAKRKSSPPTKETAPQRHCTGT